MKRLLLSLLVAALAMSAHATVYHFAVALDGPSEFPTNNSPGIGFGTVNYDDVAHTLQLQVVFSGLRSNTTAAHIHAPTASPFPGGLTNTVGVATTTPSFVGFPLGVTSGTFSNTLDLTVASSFNAAFVANNGGTLASAEAALAAAMIQGRAYWNIHTVAFPPGEIRGFLLLDDDPPVVHSVTASPSVLHPPNKKMVPVTIAVNATDDHAPPVCEIISVTSNEPADGDWEITGPLSLNLRADRSSQGNGRVYTITIQCEDDGGNVVTEEVTVTVPKGRP